MKGRRTNFNNIILTGGIIGQVATMATLWGATSMEFGGVVFGGIGGFLVGSLLATEAVLLIRKYKRRKRRKRVPDYKIKKEIQIVDTYKSGDHHYVADEAVYSEIRSAIRLKNSKNKSQREIGTELLKSYQRMGIMSPMEI